MRSAPFLPLLLQNLFLWGSSVQRADAEICHEIHLLLQQPGAPVPGRRFLKYTEVKAEYLEVLRVRRLMGRRHPGTYAGDALRPCRSTVLLCTLCRGTHTSAPFAGVAKAPAELLFNVSDQQPAFKGPTTGSPCLQCYPSVEMQQGSAPAPLLSGCATGYSGFPTPASANSLV